MSTEATNGKARAPRVPNPHAVAFADHLDRLKYRYAGAAGLAALSAAGLYAAREHQHENDVTALHEAAKVAHDPYAAGRQFALAHLAGLE